MSCCFCCSSLRGAAFFCSSVQIFVGLYFFVKWVVITFINGVHETYFQDSRQMIVYPLLLIYLTLFILLGSINFIAVEKKCHGVLKWNTRLLFLLQVGEVTGHFLLGFLLIDPEFDLETHRFYHIQFIFLNFLPSTIYFLIIFLYTRSLGKGVYVFEDEGMEGRLKGGYEGDKPSAPPGPSSAPDFDLEDTPLKCAKN